ncbi:hypothetical protein [Bacillus paranthracis]|nr:hypothetical protein [Bacillus paranthracis]MEC2125262.1 hypothetical protein [Bacillus paranthracis]
MFRFLKGSSSFMHKIYPIARKLRLLQAKKKNILEDVFLFSGS